MPHVNQLSRTAAHLARICPQLYSVIWIVSLLSLLSTGAWAESRALLIGVSNYPSLSQELQLSGPRHDVALMREVLISRGFNEAHIDVVADGVSVADETGQVTLQSPLPTRANIIAAIQRLKAQSSRGDVVVIYFAGHGSQQPRRPSASPSASPSANPDASSSVIEAQGEPSTRLHNIFLPADVGRWNSVTGEVENAIVDDELRDHIKDLVNLGASVWGIFDVCHSSALAVDSLPRIGMRWRGVHPRELGVEVKSLRPHLRPRSATISSPLGEMNSSRSSESGGAVIFYAAQPQALTPELTLPLDGPNRQTHGLFTYTIAQALEFEGTRTYRQLMRDVYAHYASRQVTNARPLITGSILDQPVFNDQVKRHRQWTLRALKDQSFKINAGSLSGVRRGDLLAALPAPDSNLSEAIGYLEVSASTLHQATLKPVAARGLDAPRRDVIRDGMYARVVSETQRMILRVLVDRERCGTPCLWDPLMSLLSSSLQDVGRVRVDDYQPQVELVKDHPDVTLQLSPTHLRVLTFNQMIAACSSPKGCAHPSHDREMRLLSARALSAPRGLDESLRKLKRALHLTARAFNLMRFAARLRGVDRGAAQGAQLEVKVSKISDEELTPIDTDHVLRVRDQDLFQITLSNRGVQSLEFAMYWLSAELEIKMLMPMLGELTLLGPSQSKVIDVEIIDNAQLIGAEHMVVIARSTEGQPQSGIIGHDFSIIAQPPLDIVPAALQRGPALRSSPRSGLSRGEISAARVRSLLREVSATRAAGRRGLNVWREEGLSFQLAHFSLE